MSTLLPVTHASTWVEFVRIIENSIDDDEPMWFRGVGNAEYKLMPSLFRHPKNGEENGFLELERKLMKRFQERSVPFRSQASPVASDPSKGGWEDLFIMQHFGIPTRLLDWTENPHIALFFALTSADFDAEKGEAAKDVAVWVLRPGLWNKEALSDMGSEGGVFSTGSVEIDAYKPGADERTMRQVPVAMWGVHNSPRIVAQRGVFTIFGKIDKAMDDVYREKDFAETALMKIVIPARVVKSLLKTLTQTGITDSTVYPDLGGLAMELKRFYGYSV